MTISIWRSGVIASVVLLLGWSVYYFTHPTRPLFHNTWNSERWSWSWCQPFWDANGSIGVVDYERNVVAVVITRCSTFHWPEPSQYIPGTPCPCTRMESTIAWLTPFETRLPATLRNYFVIVDPQKAVHYFRLEGGVSKVLPNGVDETEVDDLAAMIREYYAGPDRAELDRLLDAIEAAPLTECEEFKRDRSRPPDSSSP